MTRTVHIVTSAYHPTPGGLETWTHNLVLALRKHGFWTVVYILGQDDNERGEAADGTEILQLAKRRAPSERTLRVIDLDQVAFLNETLRLDFLLLSAALRERYRDGDVVFSNFSIGIGYTAMRAADSLGSRFVTLVAGTDFSRGFRNARESYALSEVCRKADHVVFKSAEQERDLARSLGLRRWCVIPTSVQVDAIEWRARQGRTGLVAAVSDCGYSYYKGTDILLTAAKTLVDEGTDLRMTICGATRPGQEAYWRQVRDETAGGFRFFDHVSSTQVRDLLLRSDVYCSATLGEGSSAARIAAACSGIPLVTTRCGEFAHEIEPTTHIHVVPPADAEGFAAALRRLCRATLSGDVQIDREAVMQLRRRFEPAQEWRAWIQVFSELG